MPPLVERVKQTVPGTRKQQSLAVGIIGDGANVGKLMFWEVAADFFPGLAEIRGLVDVWIAVVHEMQIDTDIGGARIEARRGNAGYGPERRKSGQMAGDVGPGRGRILGVPELTVIGARPDEPFLDLGGRDRKHHFAIELPEVVADDAARR